VRILAVPVKSLSRSKTRLSKVLNPLERGALTLAMLEDVLDATSQMPGWETWVISPDEAVLEIAVHRRVRGVTEDRSPLSAAVRQVEREAKAAGAQTLAVLLGDVAMITPEALSAALQTIGPVVVAPDSSGKGTNMLLRRPPRSIQAHFGPHSMSRHTDAAAERELPISTVTSPELAFDLDTAADIQFLLDSGREGRTRACLLQMGAGERLSPVS